MNETETKAYAAGWDEALATVQALHRLDAHDASRYRWLAARGVAFYDDTKNRYLERGLVYRWTNLDAAVDALMDASVEAKEKT